MVIHPFSCILVRSKEAHGTQNKKYYSYDGRNRNDSVDTLIDEFIRECEREAASLRSQLITTSRSLPMDILYRIEENETTGWNLIDPQSDVKLTKEQAKNA